jgi:hypothetical protein
MSTLGGLNPTLMDVANRSDADGKITKSIVELLSETNEVLEDATWLEANDGTQHKTTVRTGLPSATWRQLNYGVQPSKSQTAQIRDACGMLETYAKIDKSLADLNGNAAAFRLSEDRAFIESMNITWADTLFYGNTALNPERFMGLAPRFNALSGFAGADNVIDGGSNDTDNTSIWLVVWGPNTVHGIYPKGSKAGLMHRDLGEDTFIDDDGGEYQGYRTHYKWDCGLTVRDWRYVVRIANIEVSDLLKNAASGADLVDLMVQALELVPNLNMGRPVFYCNRSIRSFLRRQISNRSNLALSMDEVAGKRVMSFDGVPVRRCDALLNTETRLT